MERNYPLVNYIVVTYNEYAYTEKCLVSLLNDGYPNKKIIFVDNASKPEANRFFHERHKNDQDIVFVESKQNLGFGGGCNLGLKAVTSGYVAFLNNDIEFAHGWLDPIITYMEEHPEVGACQPKIRNMRQPGYFEYAGAAGGFMDVYGYPFARGRIFYDLEKDDGQYDTIIDLVWCSGTAMITKKEVLDKVGLFDEIYFMYGEEADLCWRINHAGYRLVSIPAAVVYHYGAATMSKNSSHQKVFLLHRNGLILLFKNYTVREWWRYVSIRFLLDGVTFFYYLVTRFHSLNWFALLRAYASFLRVLPKILRRHVQIRKFRIHSSVVPAPLYQKSIVFDYFVLRKKKFSDLRGSNFIGRI